MISPPRAIIAGATLLAGALGWTGLTGAEIPAADKRSDRELMSPSTEAMQADDTANPGMLAVLEGEDLWAAKTGPAARACADCHGPASAGMRGVASRYPAWSEPRGAPIDLAGQVNVCRETRQGAAPLPR